MNYFFLQKGFKSKQRRLIKIDQTQGKHVVNDIVENLTEKGPSIINNNCVLSEKLTIAAPKLSLHNDVKLIDNLLDCSLEKAYKYFRKASSMLLEELDLYLRSDTYISKSPFIMDYDTLLSNYHEYKFIKYQPNLLKSNSSINLSVQNFKQFQIITEANKDKLISSHFTTSNSDNKLNLPGIQFILSSQKFNNWILDINSDLTISTFDWVLKKLRIYLRNIMISDFEKQKLWLNKPEIHYYGKPEKVFNIPKSFESCSNFNDFLKKLIDNIQLMTKFQSCKIRQPRDVISNNGTRLIYYPNGQIALLIIQTSDAHLVLVYGEDNQNELLAMFTSQGKGLIFWPDNHNIRIFIDRDSCKSYNSKLEIERDAKWPININNKLPYSINIVFNSMVSFHCSGKNSIYIKCEKQDKQKFFNINIHDWFFKELFNSTKDNKELLCNIAYSSSTALGLMKNSTSKINRKDEISKSKKFEAQFSVDLKNYKEKIRKNLENWIDYYKNRIGFENVSTNQRMTKSAYINRCKKNNHLSQRKPEKSSTSQNISLSIKERHFLENRFGLIPSKIKNVKRPYSAVENTRDFSLKTVCPLKIQTQLLNKYKKYQNELQDSDLCYCNKHGVTEVTDVEVFEFLNSVKFSQIVVIGIISTSSSVFDENSKGKFIENSLVTLIKETYSEDLKDSFQKPCVEYERKSYRLFLYNISSSGKYLNNNKSLLLKKHQISPGMCLMFQNGRLLFADYIFNGYATTKSDLFKQMNLCRKLFEDGFHLPSDFQFSSNNESKKWTEEIAYSKIQSFKSNND